MLFILSRNDVSILPTVSPMTKGGTPKRSLVGSDDGEAWKKGECATNDLHIAAA